MLSYETGMVRAGEQRIADRAAPIVAVEGPLSQTMFAMNALALGDLGRWDEAEEMVERSCELAAPDDFASQVEWRAVLGRILVVRGRPDEALALLDEAVAIGEPTDYLDIRGRAHEVRGEVLAVLELIEEARAELDVATDIFERMGSLPAIARCRRTLAELGE